MRLFISLWVVVMGFAYSHDCQDLCYETPGCLNDPHAHGSYCKTSNSPQVCFGLYYTNSTMTEMCFFPAEPNCPETFPVPCPID